VVLRALAARGAVEDDPGREIVGEVLEAVLDLGGDEQHVLQARELADARPLAAILATLLATGPGYVWLARGGLLGLLLAVSFRPPLEALPLRACWWARVLLAAAVVMVGGLVSHAAAVVEGRWLVLWAEALHVVAVAAWVGGLLAFATVFWRARPGSPAEDDPAFLALTVTRFSQLAAFAVGILAVTGLLLARVHLAAWSELAGTSYGRWLAAKVAVFAAMLTLGAWHYGRVEPRLLRALDRGEAASSSVSRFRRSVRLEAALGVVALGLAGSLGVTASPAPAGLTQGDREAGFQHDRTLTEARVRLEVAPLRPGPNAIRLTVMDPARRPLTDATAAIVQLTPADASVGAVTFQLDRVGPGDFAAPAAVLGLIGRWSGRLVVQRSNAYDVNDRFELVVGAGTVPHAHGQPAAVSRGALPLDRYTMVAALAAAAVTLAVFSTSHRRLLVARRLVANASRPPAAGPARRCP
jgi:putative copper export protein